MICDDFLTDVYVGYSWQAKVSTLSSTVAGLKFANAPYGTTPEILGGASTSAQDYAVGSGACGEIDVTTEYWLRRQRIRNRPAN
jgi:hypothetical protein